jgi:hypothetical protein
MDIVAMGSMGALGEEVVLALLGGGQEWGEFGTGA